MEKICNFCGTINDAHHSAACVNEQRQTNVWWHESHNQAIKEKWAQTPKELKERRERIATEVLAAIYTNPGCVNIAGITAAEWAIHAADALIRKLDATERGE